MQQALLGVSGRAATPQPTFANVKYGSNFTGTNGQTSATDFSTSARTITFVGNAQITTGDSTFGAGSSLLLDGNGDHLTMPDSADWTPGLNVDFCWEFVAKPNGTFASNTDLLSHAAGAGAYPIRLYRQTGLNGPPGVLGFDSAGNLLVNFVGSSWANNTWMHLVVCRQGTTWRIYQNGVQTNTATGAGAALFNSTGSLTIGAYNPSNATEWNGWIQCARYTLTEAIYLGGTSFTPPSALFPTS